jgi:hypothetical protein
MANNGSLLTTVMLWRCTRDSYTNCRTVRERNYLDQAQTHRTRSQWSCSWHYSYHHSKSSGNELHQQSVLSQLGVDTPHSCRCTYTIGRCNEDTCQSSPNTSDRRHKTQTQTRVHKRFPNQCNCEISISNPTTRRAEQITHLTHQQSSLIQPHLSEP